MRLPVIKYCPGTLASGCNTYSKTCLNRVFDGRKVAHLLPYDAPDSNEAADRMFLENQCRISLSGVQEKFSLVMERNKLRFLKESEQGTHILKPIPDGSKNADQIPANEHLTMQIARQVFNIETAENALIFFNNGQPAYITKRFDIDGDGRKIGVEDFASLAGRTPQKDGTDYKYLGNYLELFDCMKMRLPIYKLEAPKLFRLLVFNYLFSNGDAHLKNFSVVQTPAGDYRLSPAYDLLNSRLHIKDADFALEDGLLPRSLARGKVKTQFRVLAKQAGLHEKHTTAILNHMLSNSEKVIALINASYLSGRLKRSYLQAYQTRCRKMSRN